MAAIGTLALGIRSLHRHLHRGGWRVAASACLIRNRTGWSNRSPRIRRWESRTVRHDCRTIWTGATAACSRAWEFMLSTTRSFPRADNPSGWSSPRRPAVSCSALKVKPLAGRIFTRRGKQAQPDAGRHANRAHVAQAVWRRSETAGQRHQAQRAFADCSRHPAGWFHFRGRSGIVDVPDSHRRRSGPGQPVLDTRWRACGPAPPGADRRATRPDQPAVGGGLRRVKPRLGRGYSSA